MIISNCQNNNSSSTRQLIVLTVNDKSILTNVWHLFNLISKWIAWPCQFSVNFKHTHRVNTPSDKALHCVKSVQIRSIFWSVFSCIRTEYKKIRTRKNFVLGHFSCSVKTVSMDLWVIDTLNQFLVRGFYTRIKFSKK